MLDKTMKKIESNSQDTFNLEQGFTDDKINYFCNAVCSEGKQCLLVCTSKSCKKNAIVCSNRKCKCYQSHRSPKICSLILPEFIIEQLQKKQYCFPQLAEYIQTSFYKLFDYLSQSRKAIQMQIKNFLIAEPANFFLEMSRKHQFTHFTGQIIGNILSELNQENKGQLQTYINDTQKELKRQWSQIMISVKKNVKHFETVLHQSKCQSQNSKNTVPINKLFSGSKILSKDQQKETLIKFMPINKRNFESKLLYRASQNLFSVQEFHNKCDNISHTMILVKTEFDKIIGGYTPVSWKGNQHSQGSNESDLSKESFLFSVSNKDKLVINPYSLQQVGHHKKYGPIFTNGQGFDDLSISDKANDNSQSFAGIGRGYCNPKYNAGDKESWKLFSGQTNGTVYFRILEWEVFQIVFRQ